MMKPPGVRWYENELCTMSPVRKPAANSARAAHQKSWAAPCGSHIGPGDMRRRRSRPGAPALKPPNGGSSRCRTISSDLRRIGSFATAAGEVTAFGSIPARCLAHPGALEASDTETTVERARTAYATGQSARTTAQPLPTATSNAPARSSTQFAPMMRTQAAIATRAQSGATPAPQDSNAVVNAAPHEARARVGQDPAGRREGACAHARRTCERHGGRGGAQWPRLSRPSRRR